MESSNSLSLTKHNLQTIIFIRKKFNKYNVLTLQPEQRSCLQSCETVSQCTSHSLYPGDNHSARLPCQDSAIRGYKWTTFVSRINQNKSHIDEPSDWRNNWWKIVFPSTLVSFLWKKCLLPTTAKWCSEKFLQDLFSV